METKVWLNRSQPQTLVNATMLLYFEAVLAFIFGGRLGPLVLILIGARVAGGYGIANEKRWGYQVAVSAAFAPFVIRYLLDGCMSVIPDVITLMFEVLLIVLLLHPQSRDYQRVWFK